MRILFVVDLAHPDHAGGSHRLVYEVSRRLADRGHDVHLITGQVHDAPAAPDPETIAGVHYHRLPRDRRGFITHGLSYVRGARRTYRQLVREAPFDVISAHYVLPALGVLSVRRGRQPPLVFTFHGPWTGEFGVELAWQARHLPPTTRAMHRTKAALALAVTQVLERAALSRAARVHTLSQYMAQVAARQCGVPPAKLAVIPGGVDLERFRPAAHGDEVRRSLGLPRERTVLLTVRRLYARMGLENLVRAMAAVVKERPDALLLIGGRGPLQARLQEVIEEHALAEHVHLLGFVPDERLPLYYQAADCFVLPSLELEGFGLATLEALACGTPALGTAVGGTVEILGGLNRQLLLKSPAAEDMAAGILAHLAAPAVTREQCRRYAAEHYSWTRMVVQLEQLFSDVTGPRGAGKNGRPPHG